MEYVDVVKIMKDGLENMKSVKYDKNDFLEEYITSIYFVGDILPNLKIFIGETEFISVTYGLEELIVSVCGITVNKLFISFKHIQNIKFGIQTINVILENTDIEKNFIEIPKLADDSEEKSMLAAWVEFLKNPESEKVRTLENDIKAIKDAKDELVKISADKKQRAMYEMRQKTLHDEANALYSAEKKGIEKGKKEGIEEGIEKGERKAKLELARNLLDILDEETIALKTGFSLEEVKKLKDESINS